MAVFFHKVGNAGILFQMWHTTLDLDAANGSHEKSRPFLTFCYFQELLIFSPVIGRSRTRFPVN